MNTQKDIMNYFIAEYEKLKDEQNRRIEFRDHIIYLTLFAIGSIFSYCIEKPQYNIAFLVLPFFCIIMSWTYFANDRKISSIGDYIKDNLIPRIEKLTSESLSGSWEYERGLSDGRRFKKNFQLFIDILLFFIPSAVSIFSFFLRHPSIHSYHFIIACFEAIIIIVLLVLFCENNQN